MFNRKKMSGKKISSKLHEEIKSHIEKFCTGMKGCEICNKNSWVSSRETENPIYLMEDTSRTGGTTFFLLVCKNCGNTKFFSCEITGVGIEK